MTVQNMDDHRIRGQLIGSIRNLIHRTMDESNLEVYPTHADHQVKTRPSALNQRLKHYMIIMSFQTVGEVYHH